MRKLMLILIVLFSFSGLFRANAQSLDNSEANEAIVENICAGHWVLINLAGWAVRNEYGKVLPLSSGTVVLGCDGKKTSLSPDLSGISVGIKCSPASLDGGLADVQTVKIWCR